MKKLSVLFAIVLAFTMASQAQVSFGVKGGLNLANIYGSDAEDNGMKIGYQIGGVANLELTDAFSVQPSLLLSNKGATDTETDMVMSLNYLEIPINAVYSFGEIQVFAGPYVGVGLFGKVKPDEGDDIDIEFTQDVTEATEDYPVTMLDIGLNFGAGYKVMDNLQVQAGYGLGFTNLVPKFDGEDPEVEIKNSVIQVTVSYFLR
ncbi:hypothetical protein L21SP5_02790 [Salinivirga cyanobacteriivorans]|uniref:Outer membrane protein beta-barrel domain-containing protein n=1 Tax=Salinivirga cyanobacteriivorans TaxID=1307839 RepID=A0A0S2I2E5_9BACT|nr:porin family protein [Salinivirga cyanobacteriivorans]ALO16413.1 hypothetical protein L21SP5_02790 [Salinivirga cyanobacteriivorans]